MLITFTKITTIKVILIPTFKYYLWLIKIPFVLWFLYIFLKMMKMIVLRNKTLLPILLSKSFHLAINQLILTY